MKTAQFANVKSITFAKITFNWVTRKVTTTTFVRNMNVRLNEAEGWFYYGTGSSDVICPVERINVPDVWKLPNEIICKLYRVEETEQECINICRKELVRTLTDMGVHQTLIDIIRN